MVKYVESKLKYDKSNKYLEFGKFIINMNLLNKNILLLKYKNSYAPIPNLRRTMISDDLKNMVFYLLDTGEINYQTGMSLNNLEKEVFDILISKSGLNIMLKYDKNKMKEDLDLIIEQYEILKGEIIAGNDNPKIIKDLKDILRKLVKYKKVSQSDAEDILKELE